MTNTTLDGRLRQIAILVASVDAEAARHLLLNLPTEIARKVRAMAAQMGPIPPEERNALMTELRATQLTPAAQPNSTSNVTSSLDSAARFWSNFSETRDHSSKSEDSPLSRQTSDSPAWTQLSEDALVRFIRHERPTVIAVIIHQLPAKQAASVLQRLPRSIGREVLSRLGSLQEIDPDAMQAIDEQLSHRLSDYRHKIESELENAKRINDLLAAAPPELKQQWTSWISPGATSADKELVDKGHEERSKPHEIGRSPFVEPPATILKFPQDGRSTNPARETRSNHYAAAIDRTRQVIDFERILTLRLEQLAALLTSLDSQTILLSLAGATPQFIKRFNAMLEPADAKVLEERVRRIGAVNLRDIDDAQCRVIDAYWSLMSPGSIRRAA